MALPQHDFKVKFEKFEYCRSVEENEETYLTPLVSEAEAAEYKKKIQELIASVSKMYEHQMNKKEAH